MKPMRRSQLLFAAICLVLSLITPSAVGQIEDCTETLNRLLGALGRKEGEQAPPLVEPLKVTAPTDLTLTIRTQLKEARPTRLTVVSDRSLQDVRVRQALAESSSTLVLQTLDGASLNHLKRVMEKEVKILRIVAVLPGDSKGVAKVFGERTNAQSIIKYLDGVADTLRSAQRKEGEKEIIVRIESTSESKQPAAEKLRNELAHKDENEFTVLIAHNEEGLVKLPDGTALTATDLEIPDLVLTCQSMRFPRQKAGQILTTRDLEFDHMARALLKVSEKEFFLGRCEAAIHVVASLDTQLRSAEAAGHSKVRIILGVTAFAIVGGIAHLDVTSNQSGHLPESQPADDRNIPTENAGKKKPEVSTEAP